MSIVGNNGNEKASIMRDSFFDSAERKYLEELLKDPNERKLHESLLREKAEKLYADAKEIATSKIDGTKESEIVVSDFFATDEILNKMGYHARSKQENRRIQYKLDGVEVDIDFWPHIPTYVEFEAESEQAIKDVCFKLGIDFNKLTTMDVSSIYEHYGYNISKSPILTLEEERKNVSYNI